MLRILAQNQAGPLERAAQYPLFLQLQALVFDRAHLHLLLPEQTSDDGDRQRRQQQRHDHRDTALPVEPKNFWPGTRPKVLRLHRQRGVAVIMALLLTTLAITIVASLFWQQQVQVRSIENQRLQLQKQWILRGALDWAGLILREDAKHSDTDTLDEPWAVPLAETRLDQYVENGRADADTADVTLSGSISDAQARYNLTNCL